LRLFCSFLAAFWQLLRLFHGLFWKFQPQFGHSRSVTSVPVGFLLKIFRKASQFLEEGAQFLGAKVGPLLRVLPNQNGRKVAKAQLCSFFSRCAQATRPERPT